MVDRLVAIRIELLGLFRRDDADLIVLAAMLPRCVVHWMDMQLGRGWFPCQFTQTLHKLLLEIIGDVILLAEEDNPAL